ncbi:hypothetical protein HC251_11215 [Iamia sp. SCSIO 61187]|uniref:hypothetical protein n=1 Tax=Iamia sp. SCSIO 61187 TaxID=2722752 RepID=UPI001C63081B|nr:hypothetical protein [Iamia sp. SCSIO 61187]QYG90961.1 hypothetical protein HC251_11215 [Iamia sp. SCSIO 61187]
MARKMEEHMEHGEQVHLLLSAPGQPPATLPASPWRAWLPSPRGPIDPTTAADGLRLSPMAHRAERALVAAVAKDDVDGLGRLATQPGPAQDPAWVLAALRLATIDGPSAIDLLQPLATAAHEPTESKLLRKHWGDLTVQVNLAPSVPVLLRLSRTALGLLAAELLVDAGRIGEALSLLETYPPRSAVVLAKAAALLAQGEHARVLEITSALPNVDDLSALALVARSVACRTLQDLPGALDAVCEALSDADRSGAVIAAALEERSHLYSLAGDTAAAHVDLGVLAAMASGQTDVPIPPPATLRRSDEPSEDDALDRARNRIRRRITGVGAPGTFGGRHHSTYRDEIATMFALGQVDAVEELLLGLLDVVEDEVDELGVQLDPTFFLTLADLYQDSGRTDELVALRERYDDAEARSAHRVIEPVEHEVGHDPGGVDLAKPAPVPPADEVTDAATDGGGEGTVVTETAIRGTALVPDPAETPAPGEGTALGGAGPEPVAEAEPAPTDEVAAEHEPAATTDEVAAEHEPAAPTDAPAAPTDEPASDADPEPVDLVDHADERPLTPVERAVRGPRVRSL